MVGNCESMGDERMVNNDIKNMLLTLADLPMQSEMNVPTQIDELSTRLLGIDSFCY